MLYFCAGISLCHLTDSKPPPECVVMYADYLKSKYRKMSLLPDPDWPPSIATEEHYTNLALIQKERNYSQAKKDISSVSKDYVHGNIDRIIAKKKKIDLEEAFYPIVNPMTNESQLTILMDGAPGVGKTTITRKVCIDWAKGDALPEYQLVLLVPLRKLKMILSQKVDKQLHLSDILPSHNKELLQKVDEHIMDVSGAKTLIIFDGFDELSSQERNVNTASLVIDIIKGDILHLCSVMITSRPYASQSLRSLNQVNRHIEVLGFTEEQIRDCVCRNIEGKKGDKLIRQLRERLDIGSLCYIPLNCRILLFVYKTEDFNLPSTITELYEIFLLHTIKRFAQKVELEDNVSNEIFAAKKLSKIPSVITVQLNDLSKFALEGIEQSILVFDDENLKEHVSLGLLNSLHCFITTGEATFFQFLHLTIQEFLAARYVASDAMTDEQRKSFITSNIENETYRMTILFLAGLTRFSFLSSGDSLLQPQSTFLSGSCEKERILFLAQLIYESKSSSFFILSDLNRCLDMSDYPLTKFDCLVLAHLMSNTPRDFVWEFIDMSNCGITAYSVLLKTKHSEHSKLPGIVVSKKLRFSYRKEINVKFNGAIPIASLLDLLSKSKDSPLEELTVPVVKFETDKRETDKRHQQIVQLSQALVDSKSLQAFEICHIKEASVSKASEHILSTTSKEKFVLQKQLLVCSNSLVMLLKFASLEIKKLKVIGAEPFIDCSTCGSSGEDAVKSLCEFLGNCTNIEQVKISECCLKWNAIRSILSSLVSRIHILENNEVGIAFKANEHDLEVSNYCDDQDNKGYETFLTNIRCVFPRRFTSLSVEVRDTDEKVLEYLSQNPNLKMITLTLNKIPQDKVVVRTETSNRMILKLSKSLTSIRIKGHLQDHGDILEHVARGVCQNDTLKCMEIIGTYDRDGHGQTITGLNTLLNSLKSTPVQKLRFENILFDSECTEALLELLRHKHLTDLAMEGHTNYLTYASRTPRSIILLCQTLQIKSLTVLSLNGNKLEADGTVALINFLRLNPQLTVLRAFDCNLTDDLFTDTHYWETSSLEELIINCNYGIRIKGWTNLFQSLRQNTSLIKLNFTRLPYSDIDEEVLSEMIISNKSIQYLTIDDYPYNSQHDKSLARALVQNLTLREITNNSQHDKSLARALVQNLTLKEIMYGSGFDRDAADDLKREIQKLKRDKNVTISPEWNLKIRAA